MKRQRIAILGATGSIGRSTLDVIDRHPDRFEVVALTAHSHVEELANLAIRFGASYAAISDDRQSPNLLARLKAAGAVTQVLSGADSLVQAATLPEVDTVMAAIVGGAGLASTLAAAKAGKKILLANKEALVMAGAVFMDAVSASGSVLLPIDSEHNAVFQCLPSSASLAILGKGVRRILLTGSGGPFRTIPRSELCEVTPDQACAHPNWVMGRKISVDSATMMNKGLEIIEAHWLFGAPPEAIEVVVHPQSVIHSMVEYVDGSVVAQLGNPDMRTPIAQALAYPDRIDAGVSPLDFFSVSKLTFERPDPIRFPALSLAQSALGTGGSAPALLNAANEIAVDAFLQRRLAFLDITRVIEKTLDAIPSRAVATLDDVFEADRLGRQYASRCLTELTTGSK